MSNLPPGVTDSMIPGNTPEDIALDAFTQEVDTFLTERGIKRGITFDGMTDVDLDAFDVAVDILFDLLTRYRTELHAPESERACRYCQRPIVYVDGRWIDPEASGDDSVWRETCDAHDTFTAEHEPTS